MSYLHQRNIYQECEGGEKYWNLIDQRLTFIRKKAGTNKKVVRYVLFLIFPCTITCVDIPNTYRAFRDILKTDRETYGVGEDYEIGDIVADEWQQRVDDVVAGIPAAVTS